MPRNDVLQKTLDKKRWLASEKVGYDLAGKLPECGNCEFKKLTISSRGNYCGETYDYRVLKCLCAKAYNRLHKSHKGQKD